MPYCFVDVKKKCQDYDFTTTVESESEDEVQGARRTKAGKGLDPDFVTGEHYGSLYNAASYIIRKQLQLIYNQHIALDLHILKRN